MKLCPECLTPLQHQKHQIFVCWTCPEGHGTMYPRGELENIVQAISGLGALEVTIWNDRDRYTVVNSHLKSPDGGEMLLEIRDKKFQTISVYGDPITHSLWLHTGEEEKLVEHLERAADVDSVGSYLALAAKEAARIFDDEVPLTKAAGHTLASLKLLGERILRALPHITL